MIDTGTGAPPRYVYPKNASVLTSHAVVVAAILWSVVAFGLQGPGNNARLSQFPKGNDFVVFYTSGELAGRRDFTSLVDESRFRRAQIPLLGEHSAAYYPAVYPPQVALFFAPFAKLPYFPAYLIWSAVSISLVLFCTARLARASPHIAKNVNAAMATALAFIPFPYLILAGQASAIALLSLTLATMALERPSKLLAGLALGIVAYKPSLFVPAAAVCVLTGEWVMAAAAVLTAIGQMLLVAPLIGWTNTQQAIFNLANAARRADALAMRPYLMFSWRTFWTQLLPRVPALVSYASCAGATILFVSWRWRSSTSALRRIGLLSLGVVLASPHLFLYDMVILVPALIATADALMAERDRRLYVIACACFVAPLTVPFAAAFGFQLTTPLLLIWLIALGTHGGSDDASAANGDQCLDTLR